MSNNNKLNSEQNFTMNSQLKKVKQMTFHNAFNFENLKESKKQQFIIGDYLQKGDSLDQMFEDQGQQQRRKSNELNLSIEQQFESKNNTSNEKQTNYKNTYINKINSLSKISSEIHQLKPPRAEKTVTKQHQLEEQIKRVKSVDTSLLHLNKHQEKQFKNRESARNSRTRKKIYIELLEKMTDQLDVEIGQLQNTLSERKNDHGQIQLSAQHLKNINTNFNQFHENVTRCNLNNPIETQNLLASFTQELFDHQRKKLNSTNYFFNQIQQHMLPLHLKYLLYTAEWSFFYNQTIQMFKDLDIFQQTKKEPMESLSNQASIFQVLNDCNFTEQEKQYLLSKQGELIKHKGSLERVINQSNENEIELLKTQEQIFNTFSEFKEKFHPQQVLGIIKQLNSNTIKNQQQYKTYDNLFQNQFQNIQIIKPTPYTELPEKIEYDGQINFDEIRKKRIIN